MNSNCIGVQVSFGVFESEEEAARQYDRALILEKGRNAKTNFPLRDYEAEVEEYVDYMIAKCAGVSPGSTSVTREVQGYTLPKGREQGAPDERRKTGVIYAEALRRALL